MTIHMSINIHYAAEMAPRVVIAGPNHETVWLEIGNTMNNVTLFFPSLDRVLDWADEVRMAAKKLVEQETKRFMESLDSQVEKDAEVGA